MLRFESCAQLHAASAAVPRTYTSFSRLSHHYCAVAVKLLSDGSFPLSPSPFPCSAEPRPPCSNPTQPHPLALPRPLEKGSRYRHDTAQGVKSPGEIGGKWGEMGGELDNNGGATWCLVSGHAVARDPGRPLCRQPSVGVSSPPRDSLSVTSDTQTKQQCHTFRITSCL